MSHNGMSMNNMTMFFVSIIAGLLVTMNTWVYRFSDVRLLHVNDIYMILLMAVLMVFFGMIYMHGNNVDIGTYAIYIFFVVLLFCLIRKQVFVDDVQYLRGMIPHHSMAILMSE